MITIFVCWRTEIYALTLGSDFRMYVAAVYRMFLFTWLLANSVSAYGDLQLQFLQFYMVFLSL
jgi:hypothetical protein